MKRQIPTGVFALAVILATLAVLCVVGQFQPGPDVPGSQIAKANITAPDFEGKTNTGETLRLSDQRGKVVLINFWATWCGPCRSEIPDLIALQKKYGPKGFTVIGLADDQDLPTASAFAAKMGMNYPVM